MLLPHGVHPIQYYPTALMVELPIHGLHLLLVSMVSVRVKESLSPTHQEL